MYIMSFSTLSRENESTDIPLFEEGEEVRIDNDYKNVRLDSF